MSSLHLCTSRFKPKGLFFSRPRFSSLPAYISTIRNTQLDELPNYIHNFLLLLEKNSRNLVGISLIHAQIIVSSFSTHQFVATKLVRAYYRLDCLETARHVFDQFLQPRVFLCNAMMRGYLLNERYNDGLELFRMMGCRQLEIDSCTFTFALKACTGLSDYESGMKIIRNAVECGIKDDLFLGSSMINFLVNFGCVEEARSLFDSMPYRDVVCWNSMIGGYVQSGVFSVAFDLFLDMRSLRLRPSPVTISYLIQACGEIRSLKIGTCIHGYALELGMGEDTMVLTSLVNMYSKMGNIVNAFLVFDMMPVQNLVSWNAMISGCVRNGLVHQSFHLFHRLVSYGAGFDSGTVVSLLQGCSLTANLESGKILHCCILRCSIELNLILSTALVDLYSKCGALKQAISVFNQSKNRNVITWTAMLVGLAQNGHAESALKLFHKMQEEGVAANSNTLVSLIHCCAHIGSLKKGSSIHAHLLRCFFSFDVINRTALIDMYAKCGKINYAASVFSAATGSKDVILWNSMITGYGIHGHGHEAIYIYRGMIDQGVQPNKTTFVVLLAACSHSGLVQEGINLFTEMETKHNINPVEKHYACVVDLLSRAGRLEEAEALIGKMPFEPDTAVFEALLNGCCTRNNSDIGVRTADRLLQLDPTNPGIYVMLSNIYAKARRWDAVDYIRGLMRNLGLKKTPGYSLIEVGNMLHTFFAGDDAHPSWAEIYQFLEKLRPEVEASGYVPDTSCVLRDVDEPMKVKLLWGHSERLAIAFGILNTPPGSVIKITKNLRVCIDCHSVTKYITKIAQREIVVRDATRFHHFIDGKCSCGDYW